MTRRRFQITLDDVGEPDAKPDAAYRLKTFLKRALRSWQFACRDLQELPPVQTKNAGHDDSRAGANESESTK